MEAKMPLEMYKTEKLDIRRETFYDNYKNRSLLTQAKAGCLETKSFMGKYTQNDGLHKMINFVYTTKWYTQNDTIIIK